MKNKNILNNSTIINKTKYEYANIHKNITLCKYLGFEYLQLKKMNCYTKNTE